MQKKKINSVKNSLFYLMSIGIIVMTVFFSLLQIQAVKGTYKHEKENTQSDIENAAKAYIHGIDLILLMIENKTSKKAENIQNSVIEKYNTMGSLVFSLEDFLDEKDYININIIDENNTIFRSTDSSNIGIDFNEWDKMKESLDKIRNGGHSDIDGIGSSSVTGKPMNYIYKSTDDKKYIVEIGIDLSTYAEGSHETITMNNVFQELINNKYVLNLEYFDTFGTKYSFFNNDDNSSMKIDEKDRVYFEKARDTLTSISTINKIDGQTLTEVFSPYKSIKNYDEISGMIKITYDFSYYNTEVIKYIVLIIIIAVFFILTFTYIMRKKVSIIMSPIDTLLDGINEVSMGKYNTTIDIKANNEFRILGNNFNNMVKEIETNKREVIEKRDEIEIMYEEQIAISQELEEALATNKKTYFETIKALAKAIDAKDHYTNGHCHRVMEYSVAIAKEMGYLDCQLEDLKYGALLHDIGKIGIPEGILNKKGKLTDEEFKIIKNHTSIGYNIIKEIDFLSKAKEIVYEHHEKVDGRGYPNGLKGNESNIFSRIVCAADSYDAMTSNRAYRKSMSIEQAISELEKGRGTQFDSKVVDAFINLIKTGKINNI